MIKVDIVNEVSQDRRHHQGQGRGGGGRRLRCDAALDAAGRADRAARVRRLPSEAPQARHRPQPADGQGSPHSARAHDPVQAGQGPPEHRRLIGPVDCICRTNRRRRRRTGRRSRFSSEAIRQLRSSRSPVPLRFRAARALPGLLVEAHPALPADARTTTLVGGQRYLSFLSDFGRSVAQFDGMTFWQAAAAGLLVQRHDPGDPRRARDGPLSGVPLLQPRRLAAVLHPTLCRSRTAADRDARSGDPDPRAVPDAQGALRRRHRRPDCRLRRAGPGARHRDVPVEGYDVSPRPKRSSSSASRCSSARCAWMVFGVIPDRLDRQRPPDGLRRLVRDAGDRAEPPALRPARRRAHHLRDAAAVIDHYLAA